MREPNYQEFTPTFLVSHQVNHKGLSPTDYLAAHYLNGEPESAYETDSYLDISQYLVMKPEPTSTNINTETKMDIEENVPVVNQNITQQSTSIDVDDFFDAEDNIQQRPSPTRGRRRGQRQRTGSPRRDYKKNITKTAVHSCCKDFQRDILAQRVVKKKCDAASIPYSNFVALLKQISKEYHISNEILLTRYIVPSESDPQFTEKRIFAEYFSYFLNNSFIQHAEKVKVKDLQAYISYTRNFLAYLSDHSVAQRILQNIRI